MVGVGVPPGNGGVGFTLQFSAFAQMLIPDFEVSALEMKKAALLPQNGAVGSLED